MKMNKNVILGLCAGVAVAIGAVSMNASALAEPAKQAEKAAGVKIGDMAPDFTLKDVNGVEHTLSTWTKEGKIVVLEWFNEGCPYDVRHYKDKTMETVAKEFEGKNVVFVAIQAKPEANPDMSGTIKAIKDWNITHPVLVDPEGTITKQFGAKTTPHIFIIKADGTLAYQGAIDNDQKGSMKPAERTNYVRQALNQILAGETVSPAETRPYGCSVKVKA